MTLKVVNIPHQDSQGAGSTSAGGSAAQPEDTAPRSAAPVSWHDHVAPPARWLWRHLRSPRTRLCVVGIVLLLLGVVWITNSVWTLPLIIAGIVMVAIAWVGSRLDGRFAVEWGEAGTQLEFRAQIKAPPHVVDDVPAAPLPAAQAAPAPAARPQIDDGGVIEGEGHTVEIDVAELKTLIRAAEANEIAQAARADGDPAVPSDSPDQRSAA